MTKENIKKAAIIGGGILAFAGVCTAAFVFGHKPDVVENPCWRSCHLDNGRCKQSYDSAARANWQSVKQFIRHGEICNAYKVGDKYFTGHSKFAPCRSINPTKLLKM